MLRDMEEHGPSPEAPCYGLVFDLLANNGQVHGLGVYILEICNAQ
jgi:hypothetical protein